MWFFNVVIDKANTFLVYLKSIATKVSRLLYTRELRKKARKCLTKANNSLIWLGGVAGGIFVLVSILKFGYYSVYSTSELREKAKICLSDAHQLAEGGNVKDIKIAYLCAQKNLDRAAEAGDLRAAYGLANLYAEQDIGNYLDMDLQTLADEAIRNWCYARKGGFELAKVDPPFLKSLPTSRESLTC